MVTTLIPKIRPAQEARKIQTFIKKTLRSSKHQKVIIALSGGIDSSTTLTLATRALGPNRVLALKLPHNTSFPKDIKNADLITKALKIPKRNIFQVNIGTSVERIWKNILIKLSTSQTGQSKLTNQIRLGNIMARVRMIYLFDSAKARKALVIGTENYSEHLLGYYTRFGDEASDLEPLKHLYKTQIIKLAEFLKIPNPILNSPPSAGLWQEQTDEEELEFSYQVADQVLYLRNKKNLAPAAIAVKLQQNHQQKSLTYWKRQTKKVLIYAKNSSFKHKLPYTL